MTFLEGYLWLGPLQEEHKWLLVQIEGYSVRSAYKWLLVKIEGIVRKGISDSWSKLKGIVQEGHK